MHCGYNYIAFTYEQKKNLIKKIILNFFIAGIYVRKQNICATASPSDLPPNTPLTIPTNSHAPNPNTMATSPDTEDDDIQSDLLPSTVCTTGKLTKRTLFWGPTGSLPKHKKR